MKMITIFDTSYGPLHPYKERDMIKFFEDCGQILKDFEKVAIAIKPKNFITSSPKINSILKDLNKIHRCVVFGKETEPSEIIGKSSLVISICYTSPTIEALGAKRKAIFYDPTALFVGNDCNGYCDIPNLVAHNYDELKRLINYWLFEINEEELSVFFDSLKTTLDLDCEAKAITEFRRMLMED